MDKMTTTYAGVGLATCVLGFVGSILLQRRSNVRRSRRDGGALSALEAQLGNAIFDANARERLIRDALRHTGGDRAAAIRKVLNDLHAENNRWS